MPGELCNLNIDVNRGLEAGRDTIPNPQPTYSPGLISNIPVPGYPPSPLLFLYLLLLVDDFAILNNITPCYSNKRVLCVSLLLY